MLDRRKRTATRAAPCSGHTFAVLACRRIQAIGKRKTFASLQAFSRLGPDSFQLCCFLENARASQAHKDILLNPWLLYPDSFMWSRTCPQEISAAFIDRSSSQTTKKKKMCSQRAVLRARSYNILLYFPFETLKLSVFD